MSMHVITASAGSGKTYKLTELLSERLSKPSAGRTEPLRASEVIATTFTVRAASDLVDKTQKRLLDDGNIPAAEEIGTALIGTIHSVSGRLVTDYAIDAGFSPEARILDEAEQTAAFNAAIDDIVAEAEATHRDLLLRTGHNGRPEDSNKWGHGPVAWSNLVKRVAEAARENNLGEQELLKSAEASVGLYLSALPAARTDNRAEWRDQLSSDIDELRDALRIAEDKEPDSERPPRVEIPGGSKENIKGSIITLDRFVRDLETDAEAGDPFARTEWSTWVKVAKAKYPKAPGGQAPGKYAVELLAQSSALLVSRELLANAAFQDDLATLIRLVFDTAISSLGAYENHKNLLGVMDFVDQEVRALDLLRSNERVRESVASRYRLLAVDEFQDSSPIQLAIFTELAELVDEVIWVGDRKQAIYGFRGADPELMSDVFGALTKGSSGLGMATTENLGNSWRSTDPPLELSNTIFSSVFADQPEDEVILNVPPRRQNLRALGGRELWVPKTEPGKGRQPKQPMAKTIAEGVVDFLSRTPRLGDRTVGPDDIAVLTRTHDEVSAVVDALRDRGVSASGSKINLLGTREGQFVMSGLAAIADPKDTVAVAELVTLMSDHGSHGTWFETAARITDKDERKQQPHTWWNDSSLAGLADLRARVTEYAPADLVVAVIDALDLHQRIKAWSSPETRLANLDSLRSLAAEYEETAHQTRKPATASGLLDHFTEVATKFDHGTAYGSVLVMTMHQSKGLQWPVVIVGIPVVKDYGHQEVSVEKASNFDVRRPLAGRSIRLLPRVIKNYEPLKVRLGETDTVRNGTEAEHQEAARLLYVALTRAETYSILAFGHPQGVKNQLETSVGTKFLEWDVPTSEIGTGSAINEDGVLKVADLRAGASDGDANSALWKDLRIRIGAYSVADKPETSSAAIRGRSSYSYTDIPRRGDATIKAALPARFSPSSVPSTGIDAEVKVIADLGEPLVAGGGKDWDRVGDAVHAYLALPLQELAEDVARSAAARIIAQWGTGGLLTPDLLVEAGRRWIAWVNENFPNAEILTEQPFVWRNPDNQVAEGWIDVRLLLPDGSHVLIDHKSYPGEGAEQEVRKAYLGQLSTYSRAFTTIGSTKPSAIYVHLPLGGTVIEVKTGVSAISR